MSKILSVANENSNSPYTRTNSTLEMMTSPPKRVIQAAALVVASQNDTMTAVAVISAGRLMMAA